MVYISQCISLSVYLTVLSLQCLSASVSLDLCNHDGYLVESAGKSTHLVVSGVLPPA
jgi:hypothetical protein